MFFALVGLFFYTLQVFTVNCIDQKTWTPPNANQRLTDFKTMVTTEKNRYVDKTLFIKEILDCPDRNILIMRPSGFGKTLALSTLDYFFSNLIKDQEQLFAGLKIMQNEQDFNIIRSALMGKHPVIRLYLTQVRGTSFTQVLAEIQVIFGLEVLRHKCAVEGKIDRVALAATLTKMVNENGKSINWISGWIDGFFNETQKVVILIDGLDVPLYTLGTSRPCHEQIKLLLHEFLREILNKRNVLRLVAFGIKPITSGVLPSNIKMFTFLNNPFSTSFGFTRQEVESLVKRTNAVQETEQKKLERIDAMFSGYKFGDAIMINARAVTQFLFEGKLGHWLDQIQREILCLQLFDKGLYPILTIQRLLAGETVIKPYASQLDMTSAVTRERLYWTFMLQVGYLTVEKFEFNVGQCAITIRIPNLDAKVEYAMLLEKHPGYPKLKIPSYSDLTNNLAVGNFSSALTIMKAYLQNAGKLLRNDMHVINTQLLGEYVSDMLSGVANMYDMDASKTWCSDRNMFWFFRIRPRNANHVNVRVKLEEFDETDGIIWKLWKKLVCSVRRTPDKEHTLILIRYSKFTLDACLEYFDDAVVTI